MFTIGTTSGQAAPFELPASIVTDTTAIVAKKRTGKSNTGVVIAEEVYRAGHQVVIIDPKGDWWGMRSPGTGPALPILILGGLRGDLPITPTSGAAVAQFVFENQISVIIDVSRFESKAAQARFLTEFANTLFSLHQETPRPVLLILDEAVEFLPQTVSREDGMTKCVGAWTKIIRLGGAFGLGVLLIAQRAADLNKQALTQIETLIAHRTPAERDRKAILGWLDHAGADIDVMAELPLLANGEAWIVSPHLALADKVQVRRRETFDSGETPKLGAPPAAQQRTLADVDLSVITEAMAEALEAAALDDPEVLRKRIRELEDQLAGDAILSGPPAVERVEVEVIPQWMIEALEAANNRLSVVTETLATSRIELGALRDDTEAVEAMVKDAVARAQSESRPPSPTRQVAPRPAPAAPKRAASSGTGTRLASLDKCQVALLTVLAQHPDGLTKNKLGFLAGYNPTKSTIRTALGSLRTQSFITPGGVEVIQILPAGLDALGPFDELPRGRDLYEYWLGELDACQRALLEAFVAAYPAEVPKEQIEPLTGYDPTKSTYRTAMGVLRRLDLVPRGQTRAADEFMQAISAR